MHGKLLTHLREQRSRTVSLFQFTDADLQGDTDQTRSSSKDRTKYAYGVAKGMEFLVSKGVSIINYFYNGLASLEVPFGIKWPLPLQLSLGFKYVAHVSYNTSLYQQTRLLFGLKTY